jgi:hypothetical protein
LKSKKLHFLLQRAKDHGDSVATAAAVVALLVAMDGWSR